jgi:hypothetical protein
MQPHPTSCSIYHTHRRLSMTIVVTQRWDCAGKAPRTSIELPSHPSATTATPCRTGNTRIVHVIALRSRVDCWLDSECGHQLQSTVEGSIGADQCQVRQNSQIWRQICLIASLSASAFYRGKGRHMRRLWQTHHGCHGTLVRGGSWLATLAPPRSAGAGGCARRSASPKVLLN